MSPPSNYTFVDTGTPSCRQVSRESKSVIRSHAMQQVWDQGLRGQGKERGQSGSKIVPKQKIEKKTTLLLATVQASPQLTRPQRKNKTTKKGSGRTAKSRSVKSHGRENGLSQQSLVPSPTTSINVRTDPKQEEHADLTSLFQKISCGLVVPERASAYGHGISSGVLAIAAAHQSVSQNGKLSYDAISHDRDNLNYILSSLSFQTRCLSDNTISCLALMIIFSLISGAQDDFIQKIMALERFILQRGGLMTLGDEPRSLIASCVASATSFHWEKVPHSLRHPYGLLDYAAIQDIPRDQSYEPERGSGFQNLHVDGIICNDLLHLFAAVVWLDSALSLCKIQGEQPQPHLGMLCNKVSLRFVYLKEYHPDDIKEWVRLGVYYYHLAFQRALPRSSVLLTSIQRRLEDAQAKMEDLQNSRQLCDVMLWNQFIILLGWRTSQDRVVVAEQLRMAALRLGVTGWDGLKKIFTKFLYSDRACGSEVHATLSSLPFQIPINRKKPPNRSQDDRLMMEKCSCP